MKRIGATLLLAAIVLAATATRVCAKTKTASTVDHAAPILPPSQQSVGEVPCLVPSTSLTHSHYVAVATATKSAAAVGTMNWYSINGGGATEVKAAGHTMSVTIGQGTAGTTSAGSHVAGLGFWYGSSTQGCSCPSQGDINADHLLDIFDVILTIGIAFSGEPDLKDSGCPITRGDVNNNRAMDVFDVLYLIDAVFSGGPYPIDPCSL